MLDVGKYVVESRSIHIVCGVEFYILKNIVFYSLFAKACYRDCNAGVSVDSQAGNRF